MVEGESAPLLPAANSPKARLHAGTRVYAGTDSVELVGLEADATGVLCPLGAIANTDHPPGMKNGAPGGVTTEWVLVHPQPPSSMFDDYSDGLATAATAQQGREQQQQHRHQRRRLQQQALFAITSFWSARQALLVTYRVTASAAVSAPPSTALASTSTVSIAATPSSIGLERIGAIETGGLQACHAAVSPNGRWLAIAHYVCGNVSAFACTPALGDDGGSVVVPRPTWRVRLPGPTPPPAQLGKKHAGVPLAHGLAWHPSGCALAIADAGQGRIVTYAIEDDEEETNARASNATTAEGTAPRPRSVAAVVDDGGEGVSANDAGIIHPSFDAASPPVLCETEIVVKETPHGRVQGWLRRRIGHRPRHVAFHPTGRAAFVLHEMSNSITWHLVGADGAVGPAVGEAGTLGEDVRRRCLVGCSLNAAAEVCVRGRRVWVSNRGIRPLSCLGAAPEHSITAFDVDEEDGSFALRPATEHQALRFRGMPRHFAFVEGAGGNSVLLAGLQDACAIHILATCRTSQYDDKLESFEAAYSVELPGKKITCVAIAESR